MAPHSSTLAWKIPWTEEPGRLQSMGSLRVGHDWMTSLSLSCIGEGNGNPLQCSCLENPRDGGAWWAAIYGVTQSRTPLKQLSSSSCVILDKFLNNPELKKTDIKGGNAQNSTELHPCFFLSLYLICYNIATDICCGFLARRYVVFLASWPRITPILPALEGKV